MKNETLEALKDLFLIVGEESRSERLHEAWRAARVVIDKANKPPEGITIDPAEALRRIIAKLAIDCRTRRASKRRKQRPLWEDISDLSGYGWGYSSRLATSHGFNADTAETEQP